MKALILGGTGFIGSNIVAQRPDWSWTVIGSQQVDLLNANAVEQITGDYDVIIDSAGFFGGIVFNQRYHREILYRNLIMSTNICRLVDRLNPKKFVAISSACIYPQTAVNLITEDLIGTSEQYHPSVQYSAMAKHWLLKMMATMETPWEYLILSNAYGPGEPLDFEKSHIVGSLLNKFRNNNGTIKMLGTGIAVRDFIYISDIAEAVCRYCELDQATQKPTNISTGCGIAIQDITKMLIDIVDSALKQQWGSDSDNGVLHKVLDNSKMYTDINFQPQVELSDGLARTWKWINSK